MSDQPKVNTPRASEGGHWYDLVAAEPRYEVPNASKPGAMRQATLRDARKYGWGPGVSSIIRTLASPQLTHWLIDQGIHAGRSIVQQPDESDDAWLARAREEADRVGREAAERGSAIHAAVEMGIAKQEAPTEFAPWVAAAGQQLERAFGARTWSAEKVAVNRQIGYGTKIDLISDSGILIDWKTKDDIGKDGATKLYDQHLMQLWAGAEAASLTHGIEVHTCAIGFIDRARPAVEIVVANQEQIRRGGEMFHLCANLWKLVNKYNPGQP